MVPPLMCDVHILPDHTGWPCPGSQCPVPLCAFKDALNDAPLVLGEDWRLKCLSRKEGDWGRSHAGTRGRIGGMQLDLKAEAQAAWWDMVAT